MDPAKAAFLFDRVPTGLDIDDPDDRARLVALDDDRPRAQARSLLRALVAEQIVAEDPPAVWATAQRLVALGVERDQAMAELVMALAHTAQAGLDGDESGLDHQAYEALLDSLPLPRPAEIEAAVLGVVAARAGVPVPADDLEPGALARLGVVCPTPLVELVLDRMVDQLMDDAGPLALLAGDLVVHVANITQAIVLTHRLTAAERDLDTLAVDFDLAGFVRCADPHLADGTRLVLVDAEWGPLAWEGPDGWLQEHDAGALLAVRVSSDGAVAVEQLHPDPPTNAHLVALLRAVYDEEVDEPWLPVPGEDLVLGMLVRDSDAFARPQLSLVELCAAAGLERRGDRVAHDDSVWDAQRRLRSFHRVFDALESEEQRSAATRLLDLTAAAEDAQPSPDTVRQALVDLGDPAVAEVVLAELIDEGRAGHLSEALLAGATTTRHVGTARWVAALVAEAGGDVLVAEAHLQLGLEADPASVPIVERCAWYASDRGRAQEALRLWHRIGAGHADDIATVEPFARRSGPKLGRNDACWCGSGRKYKACHPGQSPPTPLAERVGWLCRKATAYLAHQGAETRELVLTLARARAVDSTDDALLDALADPIVIDAALTEGGWFARFVEARGPLLPDDEALLAQSWTLVDRTVYEVVDVRPGEGLQARDLRTGDVLDVRERTFSCEVVAPALVCGRAVPDGQAHQFVGGLFPVAPGTEARVLELCEEGDPHGLCAYAGSRFRPPVLRTREGEALVACTAVLEVQDPAMAATVLDDRYRHDGDGWVEVFAIGDDEDILRATMSMDGSRLSVATHSETRLDRVLAVLRDALPDARLVNDQRTPLAPGQLPSPPTISGPAPPVDPHALAEIQDLLERRWIDESVPALGGLTPRQAAADPTRREELRRLLVSFPDDEGLPLGAVTMRRDRLIHLLGL